MPVIKIEHLQIQEKNTKEESLTENSDNPNFSWVVNDNVAQYSSYIISNSTHIWIESIFLIWDYEWNNPKEFICLVKLNGSEVVQLIPSIILKLGSPVCRKAVVELDKDFKNIILATRISIVILYSFTKASNLSNISYQVPDVIVVREPRLKRVGHCTKYLTEWAVDYLDFFLSMLERIDIAEIILHDGTENEIFIKDHKLHSKFEFVTYRPLYGKNVSSFCLNDKRCMKHNLSSIGIMESKAGFIFQYLSLNDCYLKLGYKYEFVSVFDPDEAIFPRVLNPRNHVDLVSKWNLKQCEFDSICQQHPFSNSLYDYIINIIRKSQLANDYSLLRSVKFNHAAALNHSDYDGVNMIRAIREIKQKIRNKTKSFPILQNINANSILETNEEDVEHVEYLNDVLDTIMCLDSQIAKKTNIPNDYKRFLYQNNFDFQRTGKSIHNTKAVKALGFHMAIHASKESIIIEGNPMDGEHLFHFRDNFKAMYWVNATTSIRSVNIDFEYLSFLAKNFTQQC